MLQQVFSDLNPPIKHYPQNPIRKLRSLISLDAWADQHQFLIYGTQQDANDLYYDGWNPALSCDPTVVTGYEQAINMLKTLPDTVVRGLEPQWNDNTQRMEQKAMYCSTQPGRSYAFTMPMNYPHGTGTIMRDCHTGFVMEQHSLWDKLAVHEAGHIIEGCGTNRSGYYWTPVSGWEGLAGEINAIFDAQGDLISAYAKTNSMEDFAEHFAYYVCRGTTMRNKATASSDVAERYAFLRDRMFLGVEYNDPVPPLTTITLEGGVRELHTGLPVEDAFIYSKGALEGFLVRTDHMGEFHVQGLPCGTLENPAFYTLWAEKQGYVKSQEITLSFTQPQIYSQLWFGMDKLPTPPSSWVFPLLVGLGIVIPSLWLITRKR